MKKASISEGPSGSKKPVQHMTVDLYESVIDDTIARVKGEFVQEGVDETVLEELRTLWEQALHKTGVCEPTEGSKPEIKITSPMVAGVTQPPLQRQRPLLPIATAPVQPSSATAAVLQAPSSQQQLAQQQQMMMAMNQYNMAMQGVNTNWPVMQQQQQQPAAGMMMMPSMMHSQQASAQLPAAPALNMSFPSTATVTQPIVGQKRPLEYKQEPLNNNGGGGNTGESPSAAQPPSKQMNIGAPSSAIPQQDGPADDPNSGAGGGGGGVEDNKGEAIGPGDSGDELNEGDDLADADDHDEIDEESIKNVVLGQFEKVSRSKQKWKLNFKNCVATIDGRDYVLKKMAGELNF